MDVPVVLPSKMPDRKVTLSGSTRGVVIRDCPGRRLSSSFWTNSISISIPGGQPSITPPTASPWDSPNDVSLKIFPKVFIEF